MFDNYKKKKLIKNIIKKNHRLDFLTFNDLQKYNLNTLLQLKEEDYTLEKEAFERLIICIENIGKREEWMISLYKYPDILAVLQDKLHYQKLETLCKKYNISLISEVLKHYNDPFSDRKLNFIDLNDNIVSEYLKYRNEHDTQKINQLFSDSNINNYPEELIKTCSDAQAYINFIKFCNKYNKNIDVKNISFKTCRDFLKNLNIDLLNEIDANNLQEYLTYSDNPYYIDFHINNYEQLKNYETIKTNSFITRIRKNQADYNILLQYLRTHINTKYDYSIFSKISDDLDFILNLTEDKLIKLFDISKEDVDFLSLINCIFKIRNLNNDKKTELLINLYNSTKNSGINFDNVNTLNLYNKIRNIYGKEISDSLTSKEDFEKSPFKIDEKSGVKIYTKSEGDFKILVHSIGTNRISGTGANIAIKGYFEKVGAHKGVVGSPQLWDSLPKELGSNYISTSLISQNGGRSLSVLDVCIVYGFTGFDYNDIRNISTGDGLTSHAINKEVYGGLGHAENMKFSDSLIEETVPGSYNEVAINRYVNGKKRKPDFIVSKDGVITDIMIEHAKYHNIPILTIMTHDYFKKHNEDLQEIREKEKNTDKNDINAYYQLLQEKMKILHRLTFFDNYKYIQEYNEVCSQIHEIEQSIINKEDDYNIKR